LPIPANTPQPAIAIPGRSTQKQIASGDPLPAFHVLVWFILANLEGVVSNISLSLTISGPS